MGCLLRNHAAFRIAALPHMLGNEHIMTVGVGLEYGFAPNWSLGVEYDHLFMGDANNSFSVRNPIFAGALNRITQDVDMVTVRVNYRWSWSGWGKTPVPRY